jgi:hypothetical protein
MLKRIWTYGIQLWGTASTSNIEILERFQLKDLHIITDAPSYVPNKGKISKSQRLNRKSAVTATITASASACTQITNINPSGTTKNKSIAKELVSRSAYQIQYVNAVIVNIVFKV